VTQHKNISDSTAEIIDEEIKRIIEESEATARKILTDHIEDLHTVANALLEYETLSREEIDTVLAGGTIDRSEPPKPAAPAADDGGETAPRPPRSSVPTSKRPKGPEPEPA
jgi:cell division protease FtsH